MKLRGYIFSRNFHGERVPQHIQNLVIRDYCKRNNFHFLLSSTEYAMPKSFLMLTQIVSDLQNIDGIAAYSIFQLPENFYVRKNIVQIFLETKKQIHFACENMKITNLEAANQFVSREYRAGFTL